MFTKHARERSQQRGIPPFVVDMLLQYGERQRDGHGAEIHYFGKRGRRRLQTYVGPAILEHLSHYLNVYAVVADGEVVTCGYRTKTIKRQ